MQSVIYSHRSKMYLYDRIREVLSDVITWYQNKLNGF